MNLILTRAKDEHLSVCWEPFATSTPLKAISDNVNIGNGLQKQLFLHTNSPDFVGRLQKSCIISHDFQKRRVESKHLVSKRTVKKKSSTYCDLSSSDEDSSGESKKRPIIKLHSGRKTKSILFSKKHIDEKMNEVDENVKSKEVDNSKKAKIISIKECGKNKNFKSSKPENIHDPNITPYDTLNVDQNPKNISISSNESKIFDETDKAKNSVNNKLHLGKKENAVNHLLNFDKLTNENALNETRTRIFREKLTTNQVSVKLVPQNNYGLQSIGSPLNGLSQNNEFLVSQKRKVKDLLNNTGPAKKTKKTTGKLAAQLVDEMIENAETSQDLCENKGTHHTQRNTQNLTHQLFSNIKEQEFINTLDLTSEEVNEPGETTECFVWQKEKKLLHKSLNSPHPSNHKSFSCNESEDKHKTTKPKRKKQNRKHFVMQENHLNKLLPIEHDKKQVQPARRLKVETKGNNSNQESQIWTKSELGLFSGEMDKENFQNHGDLENQKTQKKRRKKVENVLKKSKTSSATFDANKNIDDNKLKSMDASILLNGVASDEELNKNAEVHKPSISEEKKRGINKKKPVFQVLHELSFEENKMGCSVIQCWNVNTFKSGVFKLKVKSQMKCKTLHSNSHLGGVLVKGKLRMKIGNKELDLKEGDMAFVPPLTEWHATNIGKCESVFYYWCGRFNA